MQIETLENNIPRE